MASVFDVAKYVLEKQGPMSTWKLQKLCFYSQAWSVAWTEESIFPEEFQAWANGPVCPELFREHQGRFVINEKDLSKGDSENLTDDQKETVDIVLRDYGLMEPYELRELSHKEAPWKDAREGLSEDARGQIVITPEAMGAYYGSL